MQLIDIKLLYISPDILPLLLGVEYVTHCLYYMEIERRKSGNGFSSLIFSNFVLM